MISIFDYKNEKSSMNNPILLPVYFLLKMLEAGI